MKLTSAGWIIVGLCVAALLLDAYALRKLFQSPFYEPAQRWAQAAIVVLLPLVGAYLVLLMARDQVPMFQSPPVDHVPDIDSTCGDMVDHG